MSLVLRTDPESKNKIEENYRPIAVICTEANVHIWAYIYDDHLKAWFKHDDSVVTKVTAETLESAMKEMEQYSVQVKYKKIKQPD
jgi:hypothetical protein